MQCVTQGLALTRDSSILPECVDWSLIDIFHWGELTGHGTYAEHESKITLDVVWIFVLNLGPFRILREITEKEDFLYTVYCLPFRSLTKKCHKGSLSWKRLALLSQGGWKPSAKNCLLKNLLCTLCKDICFSLEQRIRRFKIMCAIGRFRDHLNSILITNYLWKEQPENKSQFSRIYLRV